MTKTQNFTAPNTHCFTSNIAPAHNYLNNNKYIHKKNSILTDTSANIHNFRTSKPANTSTDHNLPKHLHTALTARCIRYIRNSIRNAKCYDKLRCHTDLSLDSDRLTALRTSPIWDVYVPRLVPVLLKNIRNSHLQDLSKQKQVIGTSTS